MEPPAEAITTADSSVLIAGFVPAHRFNGDALAALADVKRGGRLLGHTMAETYAVLTATDGPYDVAGDSVLRYLGDLAQGEPAWLSAQRYLDALGELARHGIGGGAIYDGLIALAARDAGARLVSLDRRAAATYERLGVEHQLLA